MKEDIGTKIEKKSVLGWNRYIGRIEERRVAKEVSKYLVDWLALSTWKAILENDGHEARSQIESGNFI